MIRIRRPEDLPRRLSVATELLSEAENWAAAHHFRLTLNVVDDHRSAAIAFYEANGWQYTHTTRADWGPVNLRHYVSAQGPAAEQPKPA